MPWSVNKREGKFCVVKEGESSPIKGGCHPSKEEANKHMRALYAAEADYAVIMSELSMGTFEFDIEDEEYEPNLNIPGEHTEMMTEVGKQLKSIAKMIFNAHYEEIGPVESPGIPLAIPVYVEYTEQEMEMLAAAGNKDVEEFAWEGPIAFEGVTTGDNRVFRAGAIQWDPDALPFPFRWQKSSLQGHGGAVPIGRVDHMERREDGMIYAYGVVIPTLNEEAAEYLRLLEAGVASGVSVDGDSAEFDVQDLGEGKTRVEFSSMRIRSLTAVDIPAFSEAQVDLITDEEKADEINRKNRKRDMRWVYGMTAGGAPIKPPIEWFEDPKLDEPTPITVTPQGEVYGHLALFDTCHIGFPGSCVSPPRNGSYKYFHTGEIETDAGDCVEVGHLTFNTGHAAMADSAKAAAFHYDHTGTVAADVRVGEDKYGIWVAGALRSHLGDEDIRAFRAAPLSGDWRRIAGKLELVGALAVNVPGFPVPRTRTLVASGETETLLTFQEAELAASQEKRAELASRVYTFQEDGEDDPKPFSEKTAKEKGKNLSPKELANNLKDVKALLEDPEEEMSGEQREAATKVYLEGIKLLEKMMAKGIESKDSDSKEEASSSVFEFDLEEFHLVGQHDQSSHNKGGGGKSSGKAPGSGTGKMGGASRMSPSDEGKYDKNKIHSIAEGKYRRKKLGRSVIRWGALAVTAGALATLGVAFGAVVTPLIWTGVMVASVAMMSTRADQSKYVARQMKSLGADPRSKSHGGDLSAWRVELATRVGLADQAQLLEEITAEKVLSKAQKLTKSEALKHLKGLRELLDDPDEAIADDERTGLEKLYKLVSEGLASKEASSDTEEFHLTGQHDQGSHGSGGGGGGGGGPIKGGQKDTPGNEKFRELLEKNIAAGKKTTKEEVDEVWGAFRSGKPVVKTPGSKVAGIGNKRDPLNKHAGTSADARLKRAKASKSAIKWAGAGILFTGVGLGIFGLSGFAGGFVTGMAIGSVVNAIVRSVQANRHGKQAEALEREELDLGSPIELVEADTVETDTEVQKELETV